MASKAVLQETFGSDGLKAGEGSIFILRGDSMKRLAWMVVVLYVLGLHVSNASGQTGGTGALTGFVTDSSDAAITDATVQITSTTTGQMRTTQTSASGAYSFTLLPPGTYSVRFTQKGFKESNVASIEIYVAETAAQNAKLEVGSVQESVTVTAGQEQLQTESPTLGTLVNSQTITDIPLSTRNYTQIVSLSPGVMTPVSTVSQLGLGSPQLYVNGNINSANNFQMDGIQADSFGSGTVGDTGTFYAAIALPNPDALQEFKVQTGLYDAGSGRNPGANVEVITKSGTNGLHGSVFEFFRNTDLDANDFFRNLRDLPRGVMQQNQFGTTIGGPIKKDKIFFFGSYQGTRQVNGLSQYSSSAPFVPPQLFGFDRSLSPDSPTPGAPSPLAAGLGAAFCGVTPNSSAAGPGTGFFGGTAIKCDGSNINPVALALMSAKLANGTFYIPDPQTATGGSSYSIPARFLEDQFLVNLDYLMSSKNTLSERFFWSRDPETFSMDCPSGPCVPGNVGVIGSGSANFVLKLTSLLTSNLVNEAKAGFTWNDFRSSDLTPVSPQSIGMTPLTNWLGWLPNISINGLFSTAPTATGGISAPSTYILGDQISWNHGKQSIRTGFEWDHVRYPFYVTDVARGSLTFESFNDFLLGLSAAQNGSAFSNVFATGGVVSPVGGLHEDYRVTDLSSFVQDDIKLSPRLTFNVGLRWEYFGGMSDEYGNVPNFNLADLQQMPIPPAGGTLVGFNVASNYRGTIPAGVVRRSTPYGQETSMPWANFAPRVGVAWQPLQSSRFVVRSGYGWFYQRVNGNFLFGPNNVLPPNVATVGGTGTSNALATFAVPFTGISPLGWVPRTPFTNLRVTFLNNPWQTPLTMTYDLDTQFALQPSLTLEVGYVGNRSEHLEVNQALNVPNLASPTNPIVNPQNGTLITTNTAANAGLRVPYVGLIPISGVTRLGGFGDANYNSIQAALKKQVSHGLQFQASFTYGRALTDSLGGNSVGGQNFNSNNPLDLRQLYGPADFNEQLRFILTISYDLPRFHNGEGLAGKALSGWTVSDLTTIQSGLPLTFTDARGGTAFGSTASRAELCPGMTNADIATRGSVESRLNDYVNHAAFCAPPVVAIGGPGTNGTDFGDTRRGILFGPGQNNSDLALGKGTVVGGLREDARLEFRAEFFNAFNHAQFANPAVAVATTSSFGVINATSVNARLVQFALKYVF